MLVGAAVYDHRPDRIHRYNTAILFEPNSTAYTFYHKMHLVPFGEFIPLIDLLPWLASLTPYRDKIPDLSFGRERCIFEVGPYRFAATICFEDTIPQVIGRFFTGADQAHQPDMLINLSNDGWYPGSSELDMHLAIGGVPDRRAPRSPGPRRQHGILRGWSTATARSATGSPRTSRAN